MEDWLGQLIGIDSGKLGDGEKSLAWHNMPDLWVVVLIIVPAILLFAAYFYRKERRDVSTLSKLFLIFLRSAVLLLIALMIFNPVLTAEKTLVKRSHILVMIDESMSMNLCDKIGDKELMVKVAKVAGIAEGDKLTPREEEIVRSLTRMEIVNKVLSNPRINVLKKLDEKLIVEYFSFSSKARAGAEIGGTLPVGNLTAIGDAILGALNMMRDKYVAAVIVFSDGRNNHGRDPVDVAKQLGARRIPIYTVSPGSPQPVRDIELLEMEAKDVVRAKDMADVDFKIKSAGYDGEAAEISLIEIKLKGEGVRLSMETKDIEERIAAGKRVASIQPTLKDGGKQAERLSYRPEEPGDYELIVAATEKEGEIAKGNNYLSHRIKVIDDKIRVLYVEYPPRYEYRFLKNALVRDHSIQVQCLLLSADYDFPQEASPGVTPLKEFPASLPDLMNYDVIIFGDVNPMDLSGGGLDAEVVMKNIETFVSEFGGGVIFIAGVKDTPSKFRGTRLASMLPVIPEDDDRGESERTFSREVGYLLSEEGKVHPITRLLPDANVNTELWEDRDKGGDGLRGIYWFARAKKIKPTATILAMTPESPGIEKSPLFAVMPYGSGRVFYSATDDTWRWRYVVGDRYFYPFWRQAVEWVMYGKLRGAGRFKISVDKKRYAIGETVTIVANAYNKDFEPLEDEDLPVNIEPPEGERLQFTLKRTKGGKSGSYSGTFTPRETGYFNVWIGEEEERSRAYDNFSVFMPNLETDNPALDIRTLQRMADASGDAANFLSIVDIEQLPGKVRKNEHILTEVNEDSIWDSPLAYILFALFITTEWILRKMNRML